MTWQWTGRRTVSAAGLWSLVLAMLWGVCPAARPASAADPLSVLEEQAFKAAAAVAEPSIVRIETVGGLDVVGELLTGIGPTTGVVVSPDGYIITSSFNFVSRPASILVTLADGRRFPAEVVTSDDARMLTLLKIDVSREPTPLAPLAPAPRGEVRVGQWAIALGRTYDLSFPNLSVGIISAVNRVWGRAVQTDAKVSPANYGGALVDVQGRGIGILVPLSPQKTEETAGVEWYDGGIGFAIPLEDVYAVFDRLKQGQRLQPGLMGIIFPDQGVLAGEARVDRIRVDSPADRAGLRVDDVIIEANGQPVRRVPDLRHILGRLYAGDLLTLTVRRGSETLTAQVELAAKLVPYESGYLGILPVRRPSTTEPLAAEAPTGIEIREVLPNSPAVEAGLERRDVILTANDKPVNVAADLVDLISRLRPGEQVALSVRRGEDVVVRTLELAAMEESAPDLLPASSQPAAAEGRVPADAIGRANGTLPGNEGRSYWRYVPAQYNPDYPHALVIWLHPAGDTMEAAMLKLWQEQCDRRGIILAAPRAADLSGFSGGEAEFVKSLVEQMQREYAIDPARICIHGHAEGGLFAWNVGFKSRELFRAIAVSSAPLREPPPENDPRYRLQLHVLYGEQDAATPRIEKSVEVLQQLKYPLHVEKLTGVGDGYPSAEAIERLATWIDCLDRI